VNHEWLAEILMAMAFNVWGAAGLNLLRIAVFGCVLALVWRASGMIPDRQRVIVAGACAAGIYLRAHPVRPQLFSLLLFTILLVVLRRADEHRSWGRLVWVPPLMAVWVNLHGGWILGLGYMGVWCLVRSAYGSARDRMTAAAAVVSGLLATLANPYGWQMWRFLADTVRIERPMIADWQPLYELPAALWAPWLTGIAVLAVAAARAQSRADWLNVATAGTLGAAAVRVSRLDAFFALAAAYAAVSVLGGRNAPAPAPVAERRLPALSVAFAVCVAVTLFVLVPRVRTVRVPDGLMPDAGVAAYARDQKLTGQVLTWFDWGEYLIWHFGPDLKVSMDGRRETVYSAQVVDSHMRFYAVADQWRYADALDPDYIWLPRQLPVVRALQSNGWREVCAGERSILLSRRADLRPCLSRPIQSSRVFPEL
jgi:hypothetical protein